MLFFSLIDFLKLCTYAEFNTEERIVREPKLDLKICCVSTRFAF